MNANYELTLTLYGDKEQLKGMFRILELYRTGDKPAYFGAMRVNDQKIDLENTQDEAIAGGSVTINACGPYGYYTELNDVAIFRDLADAFPQGSFTAEISGSGQYEKQNLKCELKDGLLNIETFFDSYFSDEVEEAWIDDVMEKLPLEQFKKLFKVESDNFDDTSYRNVLSSICSDYPDDISEMKFDDFVGYLKHNNGKTELEEDEFSEIKKNKLSESEIVSKEEFSWDYESGFTDYYVYDPVTKSYIGEEKPLFDGTPVGQEFDANEIIAAGLRAKGLPDDADAIANLSIEDAYAALAAGMDLDDDVKDEED